MLVSLLTVGRHSILQQETGRGALHTQDKANGNYKTGHFTCEAIKQRRQLNAWIRRMGQLAQEVE